MVASICLNIGHILLQGTISYISTLTTSCKDLPRFHLLLCCHKSHLKVCLFVTPLEKGKMRRRIRQRVCQLTHSDLGVSHGLGKKARPVGTWRGRGEPITFLLHCTLGELLPMCIDPAEQWVLSTPTAITRSPLQRTSRGGPLALTQLQ